VVFTNQEVFDSLFLFGGHRLNKFEKLYFVCPVTIAEDYLERFFFAPKLSPVVAKALIDVLQTQAEQRKCYHHVERFFQSVSCSP